MGAQYFVQGLFLVSGLVSLLAAVFDWDWFFDARNMQFPVRSLGRRRARILYGALGMVLVGFALFLFSQGGGTAD